jgi:phosphatidylinositol-3-phosphatase
MRDRCLVNGVLRVVRIRWRLGVTGAAMLALVSIGIGGSAASAAGSPCGSTAAPRAHYQHVVVFVFENRTWSDVGGPGFGSMPYMHGLSSQCSFFNNWTETNTSQDSLTQYIGLTSGVNNPATVDDCNPSRACRSTDNNIFRQVRLAGGTARNFVEGASKGCSAKGNAAKHIPGLYYFGKYQVGVKMRSDHRSCKTEVRPLGELNVNALPTFALVTPNLCNDGHDCGNGSVDAFASSWVQRVINGANYQAGTTAIFVIYDEDHPTPNLLIAPTAHAGAITTPAGSHAALLKAVENMLGVPVMAQGQLPAAIDLRGPAHI